MKKANARCKGFAGVPLRAAVAVLLAVWCIPYGAMSLAFADETVQSSQAAQESVDTGSGESAAPVEQAQDAASGEANVPSDNLDEGAASGAEVQAEGSADRGEANAAQGAESGEAANGSSDENRSSDEMSDGGSSAVEPAGESAASVESASKDVASGESADKDSASGESASKEAASKDSASKKSSAKSAGAKNGQEPAYNIDWYLIDPDSPSFGISTPLDLLGLAALVNGTAVDWDDEPIDPVDFAGRTIALLGDIDLVDDQDAAYEFTPIGTLQAPFAGTFDGGNHSIRNLKITATYQYAGLFGFASSTSVIQNVSLVGGDGAQVALTTETEYIGNVGALAGKTDGAVSNCTSNVPVTITSTTPTSATLPYVVQRVGGLVGFARGDMSGCSFTGALTVAIYADSYSPDTTSDSLRVGDSFGGVVGRFGDPDFHGTLSDSCNLGDLTVQTFGAGGADRFGTDTYANTFFVGGVAGYSNGSIYNCHNGAYDRDTQIITGSVFTGVYGDDGALLGNRGGDQVGGVVGSLRGESDDPDKYNDGDPYDPMVVADCHNEAQVTGLCATGGIVGQTGVYCTVTRCFNGSITDLSDWQRNQQAGKVISTRWNKPLSGGICGQCRSGFITYCANYAEVRNIQTGYYMAGIAGCIFTSDDYPGVTGEIYACFNSGGIYTINESTNVEYREAGICGDNEGYIHDCIVMEGSVPYHSDSAIGNMDWGVTSDLYVKSPDELRSPESAALLNAIAARDQDWTCYWFINREGYPLLNSWAALDESQRIELTADMIASSEELVPAPYMGEGSASVPTVQVTLTDGTVLIQNTDFYVIPQEGAYEMSADPIYHASIVGIGLYRGTVEDCVNYSIGGGDLSKASIFVSTQKYNFGKVVFPETVDARISGVSVPADEYEYIIYGSQTSATAVQNGQTVFPAFDSEGFISYDETGTLRYPVSDVGIAAINAEERDYWLWDRNGRLISDSAGKTYYESGSAYTGTTSCVNLKSGTPAGYVVKISARASSVVLTGQNLGYYVIDPINLYQECTFEGALVDGQMWNWDVDGSCFYIADESGEVVEWDPAVTFTGETISPEPIVRYGDYQMVLGKDIRVANGDPNPSEAGATVGDESMANRNVTGGSVRAAITVLPTSTTNMSNYLIAFFNIAPADFADCDISVTTPLVAYTGEAVEPEVVVKLGDVRLVADVDYEIAYSNNVEKGTASFTVTPLENLSGGSTEPYTGSFTIGDGIEISQYTVEDIPDQQYNWSHRVHPHLTFHDSTGAAVTLTEGVDYTTSCDGWYVTKWPETGETHANGPHTLTITGKGIYVGQKTATFDIVPYDATANATNQLRVYTQDVVYGAWGVPSTGIATLPDGTKVKRGQIVNLGSSWPVMTVAAYAIVDWDAYEAGDYDSCYGNPIPMTTTANPINGSLINRYPVRYYDAAGNEVNADGSVYTEGSGTVFAMPAVAEPGTITAKVYFRTGTSGAKGGATGYVTTTFEYTSPAELSTVQWTAGSNDDRTFNGGEITPIVATTKGTGEQLVEGVDYTIEYQDNVNAGNATYTATAMSGGHFSGTHIGEFSILPYSLSGEGAVTIDPIEDQVLDDPDAGVTPVPVVHAGESLLVQDVDYEVRYQNNHTLGDNGAVVVMGIGNYSGVATATFRVVDHVDPQPEELVATVSTEPVPMGAMAAFTVQVEGAGDAELTYAWQYSADGDKWYTSSAAGHDTATMTTAYKASVATRQYRCIVTASDGREAISGPIGFEEAPPTLAVTVTTEPVALGSTATFTAHVEGAGDSELTYAWYYSTNGGATWFRSSASGQGTEALSTTYKDSVKTRLFRCTVTVDSGESVTSEPVGFEEALVVTVTTEPVALGSTATFTAHVTGAGDAELSYVWHYSTDGGARWYRSSASGQGTEALSTTYRQGVEDRLFRCSVTASDGREAASEPVGFAEPVGDPLSLTVSTAPVYLGETATFTVQVEGAGDATLTYVWQYSKDGKWYKSSATGQGTAALSTVFKDVVRDRQFRCIVTAEDGRTATSNEIGFLESPGDPLTAVVTATEVSFGETETFTVAVTGAGELELSYTWMYSDNGGAKWFRSSATGQGTAVLSTACIQARENRQFCCIVTAADGRTVTSAPVGFNIV